MSLKIKTINTKKNALIKISKKKGGRITLPSSSPKKLIKSFASTAIAGIDTEMAFDTASLVLLAAAGTTVRFTENLVATELPVLLRALGPTDTSHVTSLSGKRLVSDHSEF